MSIISTVSTSLKMFDMMTAPLQQVTQSINLTISAMDKMANAANQDIKTATTLNAAREAAQRASASLIQLSEEQKKAANNQDKINNSFNRGIKTTDNLMGKIKGLAGAYAGIQGMKMGMDTTDNYVNQNTRLSLINDGLQTQAELNNKIYNAAQRSKGAYSDTVNTVAKLGMLAKDSFTSNDETIAFAELMNKSFKLSGASISEATNGMYQLTQAMASGRLQGDEFRSVMENAPMLAQAIAKYTGKSIGDLRKMSAEGTITANVIKASLFSAADDINAKFSNMPQTFGSIWTSIKSKARMEFAPIMQNLNNFLNSANGSAVIQGITGSIFGLAKVLGFTLRLTMQIAALFTNNWSWIKPIILGIVGALLVYSATMGIAWLTTLKATAIKIKHAIVSGLETAAIIAMTFAQQGLNAALALCPLSWIIIGIIILIALFYGAVAAINHFTGSSISATGIIAGVFSALGITIYNVFAAIWNVIAAVAEFLVNANANSTYAAKKLFVNLANTAIDMCISMTEGFDGVATNLANAFISGANLAIKAVNWIIEALNKIPGVDIGTMGELGKVDSITSSLKNVKKDLNSWLGQEPSNYINVPRMDMKSVRGAFDSGYSFGDNLSNKLDPSNLFKSTQLPNVDITGFDFKPGDLGSFDPDSKKKLKNIDDKIDISNEHLEVLRDLAEIESIQNFVTLTPTVQVTTGDIREEANIDTIIAKIENYMTTELASSAEGVYA